MPYAKPEDRKAQRGRYYLANRDEICARNRAYAVAHPEQARAYSLAYYRRNKDKYRSYYERNREAIAMRSGAYRRVRRDEYYDWLRALNDTWSCLECGGACECWHHRNPGGKSFDISRGHEHSLDDLLDELDKCDPLCTACHSRLELWRREFGL